MGLSPWRAPGTRQQLGAPKFSVFSNFQLSRGGRGHLPASGCLRGGGSPDLKGGEGAGSRAPREGRAEELYPQQGRGAPPFQKPQGSPRSSSHRSRIRAAGFRLCGIGTPTQPAVPRDAAPLLRHRGTPRAPPRQGWRRSRAPTAPRGGRGGPGARTQQGSEAPIHLKPPLRWPRGIFEPPKPPQGPKARSGGTKGQRAGTREALLPAPCTLTPQGTGQRSSPGRHAPPATWNRAWPPPKKTLPLLLPATQELWGGAEPAPPGVFRGRNPRGIGRRAGGSHAPLPVCR